MTEYRFEFKYLLDTALAKQVESFVKHHDIVPDPLAYGQDGSYHVTSLYFDNDKQADYYDKKGGLLDRIKIRLRTHGPVLSHDTDKSWLELKKRHDAMIKKIRYPLSRGELQTLLRKGPESLWRTLDDKKRKDIAPILWEMMEKQRRPKTLVRYLRRAYVGWFKGERVRVTFDFGTEIATAHPSLSFSPRWLRVEPRGVILEIKTARSLPGWFGNLVQSMGLERISVSKYARSVEKAKWYEATAN
jgi:hypothetical protein